MQVVGLVMQSSSNLCMGKTRLIVSRSGPSNHEEEAKRKISKNKRTSAKFCMFFELFRSVEKMAWDGPKWGREDFFSY